jgi:hypothetical protein
VTKRKLRNVANGFGEPWTVTYQDATGRSTELALGAAGTVLTSAGASAAPVWGAGGGGSGTFDLDDGDLDVDPTGPTTFDMDDGDLDA